MTKHPQSETRRSSRLVPLVGALGVIMIAAGILIGAVNALRPEPGAGAPSLVLIAPADGDTVASPVGLRFTAGNELSLGPMGWTSNDLHLHAWLDGTEVMPAAADIRDAGDGTFLWTLDAEPGARTLQLRWAGMDHGDLDAGASRSIGIIVR